MMIINVHNATPYTLSTALTVEASLHDMMVQKCQQEGVIITDTMIYGYSMDDEILYHRYDVNISKKLDKHTDFKKGNNHLNSVLEEMQRYHNGVMEYLTES